MTTLRTWALRALLAVLVAGLAGGCLPIGFRGSSLYVPAAVVPTGR